jgi:hypothetical protein
MRPLGLFSLAIALLALAGPVAAQDEGKLTITGSVIQVGGSLGGQSTPITIQIERANTDAQLQNYYQILKTQGQDGLFKAVEKEKLGFVAISGKTGNDIRAVRVKDTPAGKRYTLLLERWVNFGEARYSGRSLDYKFSILQFILRADGKGEGKAMYMVKIKMKKDGTIEMEHYGTYPANLVGLMVRK